MRAQNGRPDRVRRVESLVRQTVAMGLLELLDTDVLVTVTSVQVSPDLRNATVWLGVNSDDIEKALGQVSQSRQQMQRKVGEVMSTKFVPRLEFRIDKSGSYSEHINRLLKGL
jgi:ribosome-binding factor A